MNEVAETANTYVIICDGARRRGEYPYSVEVRARNGSHEQPVCKFLYAERDRALDEAVQFIDLYTAAGRCVAAYVGGARR